MPESVGQQELLAEVIKEGLLVNLSSFVLHVPHHVSMRFSSLKSFLPSESNDLNSLQVQIIVLPSYVPDLICLVLWSQVALCVDIIVQPKPKLSYLSSKSQALYLLRVLNPCRVEVHIVLASLIVVGSKHFELGIDLEET